MSQPPTLHALVIDDSALYRKFVKSVLSDIPGVDVIGTAANGRIGLEKIRSLKPDLITLDFEMPELDGLGLLRELSQGDLEVATIMISSLTAEGAITTNEALQLGAFDFVLKPTGKSPDESRLLLTQEITPKIEAFVASRNSKSSSPATRSKKAKSTRSVDDAIERMTKSVRANCQPPEIVGIGISTGGPSALSRMLPMLPSNFPCPIFIVQHMPPIFTKSLAEDLNRNCKLEVMEGADGMVVNPGQVVIAPGGLQMRVAKVNHQATVEITDDPPELSCKPAVDYLFRSIAEHYGQRSVGAILTGMGDDGTIGCKLLKRAGANIITQNEETCVVYGMPRSVVEAGLSDHVAPLDDIADSLMEAVGRGTAV